ncbi:MAG TPA: extensin family protein [Polyangiales bacterium]|jgi:hypothetical protein|nr:extensin family protein [Polyangiales bacterium]
MGRTALLAVLTCVMGASGCAFPLLHTESRRRGEIPHSHHVSHEHARSEPVARREGSVLAPPSAQAPDPAPPAPDGTPQSCYEALRQAGVQFEIPEADGVAMPLRLLSPVGGVSFEPSDKSETHSILDCRLALALLAWSQDLRARGIVRVEHYSMYRPGAHVAGDGRVSGHAHGLAIDAAKFTLQDGTKLDVLDDWEGRSRKEKPCPMRPDEGYGSRTLRGVTCEAVDQHLFQVIITPHHDKAHQNHVHLERKPEVDWTYVR